jgi:iron(III) transport system permease protein
MKQPPSILYVVLLGLLAFVFVGYVIYPIIVTIYSSLHVDGAMSFGHYRDLLNPGNVANFEAVWNSVLVSMLSVVFSGLIGVLFAFVFTQFDFFFRDSLSRLVILPIALPPLVGVISFLFVSSESGILPRLLQEAFMMEKVPFYLDGMAAIVVVHAYSFNVFFYLFVSTSLRQLDPSLVEAASSLRSTPWNTFRRIIVPELRPALIGASVLTFMASMASFSAPFLFGGKKLFLTTMIYSTKLNGEMDLAAAQSMLLMLVSVSFFFVLNMTSRSTTYGRRSKGAFAPRPIPTGSVTKTTLIACALLLLVIELLPILTIFLISFAREGSWTWQLLPTAYTIENYLSLLSEPRVFEPIKNSLLMSLLTVGGAVVVGVTAAYLATKGALRRFRFIVDVIVTLPFAIPGTVIAISLILSFNTPTLFSGYSVLIGTFGILPLAYFIRMYPLVVRSSAAALEQLDDSLMEVAETFGAGTVRRFRKIVLPIILPGVVSGSLLIMIAALGEFVSSILLYTYSSRPISIEILSQLRVYNFGAAAAYCVVLLILILLLIYLANLITRTLRSESHGFGF